MKKIAVTSVKTVKAMTAKAVPPVKPVRIAKAKAELNTDALEKPHMVSGKPHNFRYK